MGLKLSVIGAASSYTPELIFNIAQEGNKLDIEEVSLVDLNAEKLELITSVCERLVNQHHMNLRLKATTSVANGVSGADFVIPQIRVGVLTARVRDETLPMELGMVGNETTGAGGFACALRTVPVMVDIARIVESISPYDKMCMEGGGSVGKLAFDVARGKINEAASMLTNAFNMIAPQ
jgi:6-phospho-beta-glucosidase